MFKNLGIMLFSSIFDEIFGTDSFEKNVKRVFEDFNKTHTDEKSDDNEEHSYFYGVSDVYEGGKHTSHIEREVKDGEVLKDINETYKIEDKKESCKKAIDTDVKNTCCDKDECDNVDKNKWYEDRLSEANELLNEAKETIQKQTDLIDKLNSQHRCYTDELKHKNARLMALEEENKVLNTKFETLKGLFNN